MYRQYVIKSGALERVCWLNNTKLKKGDKLTLKRDIWGSERVWEVESVYDTESTESQWRSREIGSLK